MQVSPDVIIVIISLSSLPSHYHSRLHRIHARPLYLGQISIFLIDPLPLPSNTSPAGHVGVDRIEILFSFSPILLSLSLFLLSRNLEIKFGIRFNTWTGRGLKYYPRKGNDLRSLRDISLEYRRHCLDFDSFSLSSRLDIRVETRTREPPLSFIRGRGGGVGDDLHISACV